MKRQSLLAAALIALIALAPAAPASAAKKKSKPKPQYSFAGSSKDIAKIRNGRLTFTYPGFDDKPARITFRLPGKVGGKVNKPTGATLSTDPQDGADGCSHTEETDISGGVTVIRRR